MLESFDVVGRYDCLDALANVPWTPLEDRASGRRAEGRPAPNVVVDFGTAAAAEMTRRPPPFP